MNTNRNSPLSAVVKVAFAVLGGEFLIMLVISTLKPFLNEHSYHFFWEFIDPFILTLIVVPILHIYVFRPMREQQIKLEKQNEELSIAAIAFNSKEGIMVTDANYIIIKTNPSFTQVTGYTSEEALGQTPRILHSGKQDKAFYRNMKKALERNKYWQGEIWNRRKNGEIYPEWLTINAVITEKGHTYYVAIFSDITLRQAYEEKITFLAYHDPLTTLPTRKFFYDLFDKLMSKTKRKQDHIAFLFLDLDGFKAVNDNYGHDVGDEVLKITTQRLLACVRDIDTVARLGGDEFVIALIGIEKTVDITSVTEKIIQKIAEPIALGGKQKYRIGVRIGIAIFPKNGAKIDSLMKAADNAMYESKSRGGNTYTFSKIKAQ